MQNKTEKKAEQIRDVIRYIQKFQNATVVIYLDDEVIDSPLFSSHIRDIALLHQAGIKVAIVPGAKKRIDQVLKTSRIKWTYENEIRITNEKGINLIKMAAFDISNVVMTSLAANHITATIGNWVRARAKGVINGIDFVTAGEIDKIQTEAIQNTLENGFIPIFPCIGWSSVGKPYNISSIKLAESVATNLKADKLFFLVKNGTISSKNFDVPKNIGISSEGNVPAMDLVELEDFIKLNSENENKKIISLLKTSENACKNGVSRAHILNGSQNGAIPCEIFSDLGSGTMIYSQNYGHLRPMTQTDIPSVLSVMNPFIQKKILLPRTESDLNARLSDYVVYEIDGGIRATASLHIYDKKQAEIAGLAVDESFSNLGIGPKIIDYLIQRAKNNNLSSVFILTTQTSDWFEQIGFKPDKVSSLPEERKNLWTPERNSKVFRIKL